LADGMPESDLPSWAIVVWAVGTVGLVYCLYRALFADWGDLNRCAKFWMTPDVLSCMRGKCMENLRSELRIGLLIGGAVVAAGGLRYVLGLLVG
jgi:hypothetical protein